MAEKYFNCLEGGAFLNLALWELQAMEGGAGGQ